MNEIIPIIALALIGIGAIYVWIKIGPRRFVVSELSWAVPIRTGQIGEPLSTGSHWILPWHTSIKEFDRRPVIQVVPGQEVLTKDNLGLKLSIVAETQVTNPLALLKGTEEGQFQVHHAVQTALREIVSDHTLDELLDDRNEIVLGIEKLVRPAIEKIGLALNDIRIRDIMLAKELRETYSGLVLAQKQGQIALERARGETSSLRNLANAARLLKDNPDLLQLRIIQAMTSPDSANNTFVVGQSAVSVGGNTSSNNET